MVSLLKKRGVVIAAVIALVVAAAGTTTFVLTCGPADPGDEIRLLPLDDADRSGYVAGASYEVGTVINDGTTSIEVTDKADAPIRILSVKPINPHNGATKPLGVMGRALLCPPCDYEMTGTTSDGFPPDGPQRDSFKGLDDLVIPPPKPGQSVTLHLILGHNVVSEGMTTRDGLEITYEYKGRTKVGREPSLITICAPIVPRCDRDEDPFTSSAPFMSAISPEHSGSTAPGGFIDWTNTERVIRADPASPKQASAIREWR